MPSHAGCTSETIDFSTPLYSTPHRTTARRTRISVLLRVAAGLDRHVFSVLLSPVSSVVQASGGSGQAIASLAWPGQARPRTANDIWLSDSPPHFTYYNYADD
jgi:hypothetical protein